MKLGLYGDRTFQSILFVQYMYFSKRIQLIKGLTSRTYIRFNIIHASLAILHIYPLNGNVSAS